LVVAAAMSYAISGLLEDASGIALDAGIGMSEVGFALTVAALGAVLAVVRAILVYR
jgi:hypothetical protein